MSYIIYLMYSTWHETSDIVGLMQNIWNVEGRIMSHISFWLVNFFLEFSVVVICWWSLAQQWPSCKSRPSTFSSKSTSEEQPHINYDQRPSKSGPKWTKKNQPTMTYFTNFKNVMFWEKLSFFHFISHLPDKNW